MVKKRRRHAAAFKFRVALEALEGSKTISQLPSEHEIHANQIRAWKRQPLEDGPSVFATNGERKQREQEAQEAELYEQIGRLKMELEWFKKKATLSCGLGTLEKEQKVFSPVVLLSPSLVFCFVNGPNGRQSMIGGAVWNGM